MAPCALQLFLLGTLISRKVRSAGYAAVNTTETTSEIDNINKYYRFTVPLDLCQTFFVSYGTRTSEEILPLGDQGWAL